jgi:hypothetical protein
MAESVGFSSGQIGILLDLGHTARDYMLARWLASAYQFFPLPRSLAGAFQEPNRRALVDTSSSLASSCVGLATFGIKLRLNPFANHLVRISQNAAGSRSYLAGGSDLFTAGNICGGP